MNWIALKDEEQLQAIIQESKQQSVVIFKHSTRCPTSDMVKTRLDRGNQPDSINFYYLDLIQYRSVSNKIAEVFGVRHESPQVLVIKDGKCVYNESHNGIYMDDIISEAA